jgi:hypothetical protein
MMYYLTGLAVAMTAVGIAVLAAVYLVSKNRGRRRRAWQLLQLLLGRQPFPENMKIGPEQMSAHDQNVAGDDRFPFQGPRRKRRRPHGQ